MATRRIARGRGGSPVPIIILFVIAVGLAASTVVLGMKASQLRDDFDKLAKQLDQEKERRSQREDEFRRYENLVGLDLDAAQAQFDELAKKLPEVQGAARAGVPNNMKNLLRRYADATVALQQEVTNLTNQLATARQEYQTLETSKDALEKEKQRAIAEAETRVADLQSERQKLAAQLQEVQQDLNDQIDTLKGQVRSLETKVASLEKDLKLKDRTLAQKDELIEKLRNPPKPRFELVTGTGQEGPDGKILTVEPGGEYVMIDVGRRDWASEGMEFRVFDETNPEARKEKGRIQVRRVYDTISQAKILQQDPMDPILRGMIIVNPAFSRGRELKFVLEGRFVEPNLERLLGRYPCAVEDKVTRDTDYLVIGGAKRRPGEPSWKDSNNYKLAEEYRVPILMERDLLRYLGEE